MNPQFENSYLKTIDTNLDRIVAYLQGKTEYLPESLHQLLDRLDYIDNLIRGEIYNERDVIPMVLRKYPEITSKRTVDRLIKAAKDVHRSRSHRDKMYELDFMYHQAVRVLRESLLDKNFKQANTAIANLIKLHPMRHEEANPYEELQPHTYVLVVQNHDGSSQRINLGDLAEEIPFEEMNKITDALSDSLKEKKLNALMESTDGDTYS